MKKRMHILLLMVVAAASLCWSPRQASGQVPVPEVRLEVRLVQPASVNPCDVVLEPIDGAPMPHGNVLRMASDTEGKFQPLPLTKAGTYSYKVYLRPADTKNVRYDRTVYLVNVNVVPDGEGRLVSEVIARAEGSSEKGDIVFTNTLEQKQVATKHRSDTPKTDDVAQGLWIVPAFVACVMFAVSRHYGINN